MQPEVVVLTMLFFLIGFVVLTIFSTIRRYKTTKLQADLQTKLLDKFASSQELLAYVQSDAGKRLMESVAMEQKSPYGRILGAAQASAILVLLGLAVMSVGERRFLVVGTMILSLGIGFGLAAALSYFLSKKFGLLGDAGRER